MKYVPLKLFILMTNFCCRLIGDYLLPPSNVLPCSCKELCATIKHIGMEYQSIDVYHQDHVRNTKMQQNAPNARWVDIKMIKWQKRCLSRFFVTSLLFCILNDYLGAVAWHNLWITMHMIEVETLFKFLWMI